MRCHNCRHNAEIARLRDICVRCRLCDDPAGAGSVSLDAVHDGMAERVVKVAPNHQTTATFDPGTIDEPPREPTPAERTHEAMHTLLSCLAAIPYDTFRQFAEAIFTAKSGRVEFFTREEYEILVCLLNSDTMTDYARANGMTKQKAWARIKNLFTRRPILQAVANGKLNQGKGGRTARPAVNSQLDFMSALERK